MHKKGINQLWQRISELSFGGKIIALGFLVKAIELLIFSKNLYSHSILSQLTECFSWFEYLMLFAFICTFGGWLLLMTADAPRLKSVQGWKIAIREFDLDCHWCFLLGCLLYYHQVVHVLSIITPDRIYFLYDGYHYFSLNYVMLLLYIMEFIVLLRVIFAGLKREVSYMWIFYVFLILGVSYYCGSLFR